MTVLENIGKKNEKMKRHILGFYINEIYLQALNNFFDKFYYHK